jgi:hypothetical protein
MSVKVTVTQSTSLQAMAEAAARQASEFVMEELFAAFQASFAAPVWKWPRETVRVDGPPVTSPRNIQDTQNLKNTGYWDMIGPYQAIFKWSAPYALGVHEGYVTKRQDGPGVIVPARPWTRAVLGQENVSGIRVYKLGDRLKNVWLANLRR